MDIPVKIHRLLITANLQNQHASHNTEQKKQ